MSVSILSDGMYYVGVRARDVNANGSYSLMTTVSDRTKTTELQTHNTAETAQALTLIADSEITNLRYLWVMGDLGTGGDDSEDWYAFTPYNSEGLLLSCKRIGDGNGNPQLRFTIRMSMRLRQIFLVGLRVLPW